MARSRWTAGNGFSGDGTAIAVPSGSLLLAFGDSYSSAANKLLVGRLTVTTP
jgi:hypothetical protein